MGTIRQGIFSDVKVENLLNLLGEASNRVKNARDLVANLEHQHVVNTSVKDAEERIRDIEDEEAFIVRNEKNDDGKPLHSNDTLRAGALRQVLNKSGGYAACKKTVIEAKTEQSQRVFELAKAKNAMTFQVDAFKAAIAAAGLIQGLCMEENAEARVV